MNVSDLWRSIFRIGVGLYWLYFASQKWTMGVGWMRPLIVSLLVAGSGYLLGRAPIRTDRAPATSVALGHPVALPLTALNDALRATILEGSSLASQSGRILVLVLWGGISFALALRWFRWT